MEATKSPWKYACSRAVQLARYYLPLVPCGMAAWWRDGTRESNWLTAKGRYGMSGLGLGSIQRGKRQRPPRLFAYGTPGVGKSTWANGAPNPVFIPTEDGLGEIDCASFPLAGSYGEVIQSIQTLLREPHDFETVVIDTLDWLEKLIWEHVCADASVKSIDKVGGGYGKGYDAAVKYWQEVVNLLDLLRDKGMVIILLAHTKVERFEDPEATPYDRYSPKLHKAASALVTEWADAVLFATRKFRVQSEDTGFNRKRSIAHAVGKDGGDRVLRCIGGPSCVAKNRFSITEELPLSWAAFMDALARRQAQPTPQAS